MAVAESIDPPLLAFVYQPRSFSAFAVAEASRGLCDLVWVVDESDDETASMSRLLERYGDVVDVAGQTTESAAELLAERRPRGLLALADDVLCWTAEVAAFLGLPFMDAEAARRVTDKDAQRSALAASGLTVPRHRVLNPHGGAVAWDAVERDGAFPAVLKPRRGQGSRETWPVANVAELRELWRDLATAGTTASEFVLEEYIPDASTPLAGQGFANYVSVESLVIDGAISHLAINGRTPPARWFRETGFFIPASLDEETALSVLEVATRAIRSTGLSVGCLHTEIKLTPTGPVVIEVNGRIGGGVPEMLALVSDVRFLGVAMRLALGETIVVDGPLHFDHVAFLFYVQAPDEMHRIRSVDGLGELAEVPGVAEVVLNRGPGQAVDWREGNHGYVYSVLGTVADHDELRALRRRIDEIVRIEGD